MDCHGLLGIKSSINQSSWAWHIISMTCSFLKCHKCDRDFCNCLVSRMRLELLTIFQETNLMIATVTGFQRPN